MNGHLYRSRDDRMLAGVAGGLADLWDADPSMVRIVWALLVLLTGGLALVVYIVMAIVVPEDDGSSLAGQALAWTGTQGPASAGASGSAAGGEAATGTGSTDAAADGVAGSTPPAAPLYPTGWPQTRAEARARRRAESWEARGARRRSGAWDGRTGATIVGVLLILVGVFNLVREFLPTIDFDWFWPLVLVVVGVLVLALAVRPRPDGGAPAGPAGPGLAGSGPAGPGGPGDTGGGA